jgi:competence protein ComEA
LPVDHAMKTRTFLRVIALTLTLGLAPAGSYAADKKPQASTNKAPASQSTASKVDLNTADSETLQTLPGVGPSTASAIIAARPFKSVSDLENVRGIGPEKMKDLRDKVRVSQIDTTKKPATAKEPKPASTTSTPAASSSKPAATTSTTTTPSVQKKPATTATDRSTTSSSSTQPRDEKGRFVSRININTATQAELESLPEIGPVKAQAIIEARPFSSVEDVMRVKGIKEGTFEVIKDRITVR